MAKRRGGRRSTALDAFAEDLGRILGTAQTKAENWLGQRRLIETQLTQIRDSAAGLLRQLAGRCADLAVAVRRGRRTTARAATRRGPGRPKGRKVSAAARRKMSLAAKRRWAARKAAAKNQEK
jgi:hypothetical protein